MDVFNTPAPCSRPQCRLSDECGHNGDLCQPESEFMDEARAWVESRDMGLRKLLIVPLFEQYYRMWLAGQNVRAVVVALDQILRSSKQKFYRRY